MATKKKELRAFHGDPEIKKKYLLRVHAHEVFDEIKRGQYWEDGKGCAVGCTIHGSDHADYEKELGIPEDLAFLQDNIFEHLVNGEAKKFPRQFLQAIKVGADLSGVVHEMRLWMLTNPKTGLVLTATTAIGKSLAARWVELAKQEPALKNHARRVLWSQLREEIKTSYQSLDATVADREDEFLLNFSCMSHNDVDTAYFDQVGYGRRKTKAFEQLVATSARDKLLALLRAAK